MQFTSSSVHSLGPSGHCASRPCPCDPAPFSFTKLSSLLSYIPFCSFFSCVSPLISSFSLFPFHLQFFHFLIFHVCFGPFLGICPFLQYQLGLARLHCNSKQLPTLTKYIFVILQVHRLPARKENDSLHVVGVRKKFKRIIS